MPSCDRFITSDGIPSEVLDAAWAGLFGQNIVRTPQRKLLVLAASRLVMAERQTTHPERIGTMRAYEKEPIDADKVFGEPAIIELGIDHNGNREWFEAGRDGFSEVGEGGVLMLDKQRSKATA